MKIKEYPYKKINLQKGPLIFIYYTIGLGQNLKRVRNDVFILSVVVRDVIPPFKGDSIKNQSPPRKS